MDIRTSIGWRVLTAGIAAATVACAGAVGNAGKGEEKKDFTVSKRAYKRLTKAQELLEADEFEETLEIMEGMRDNSWPTEYERALSWQITGQVHASKDDLPRAGKAFEECLSLDALPDEAELDVLFNLGQLYVGIEKYRKAAAVLHKWAQQVKNPTPQSCFTVAWAYAQDKQFKRALPYALKAVKGMEKPSETCLNLLLSIRFELGHKKETVKILKRLIAKFPKKTYWLQLSGVYGELGQDEKALAVMEIAHHQGLLTQESELSNLAKLYMLQEVPLKAAQLLEEAMQQGTVQKTADSMDLLANAWLQAREHEKAEPLMQEAAGLSENGELYLGLAQLYVRTESWKKAARAAQKALDKGGLASPGDAHLVLGIAHTKTGRHSAAHAALSQAEQFEATQSSAREWLEVLGP